MLDEPWRELRHKKLTPKDSPYRPKNRLLGTGVIRYVASPQSSDVKPDTCLDCLPLAEQVLLHYSDSTNTHLMGTFIRIRLNCWNRTQITQLKISRADMEAPEGLRPGSFHLVALSPLICSPLWYTPTWTPAHLHSDQWDGKVWSWKKQHRPGLSPLVIRTCKRGWQR